MFQKLQRNIDYYFQIQTPKDLVRFKSSLQYFVLRMCIYQKFVLGKYGFTGDFKVEAIAMISPKLSGITIVLKTPLRLGERTKSQEKIMSFVRWQDLLMITEISICIPRSVVSNCLIKLSFSLPCQ